VACAVDPENIMQRHLFAKLKFIIWAGLFITGSLAAQTHPEKKSEKYVADPDLINQSRECLQCHQNHKYTTEFTQSEHQELSCLSCHTKDHGPKLKGVNADVSESVKPSKCAKAPFKPVSCVRCHESEEKDYHNSVHNGKRLNISCAKCHTDVHTQKSIKNDKLAIAQQCSECHSHQHDFFDSVHGKGVKEGVKDAPTCTDCHGTHSIAKVDNKNAGRIFHTKACLDCHSDHKMMERNKVAKFASETFFASYHGKNVRLGYPEKVAGCADCHDSHGIQKADHKDSWIHKDNIVKTCAQCHSHATASFTKYSPHADHHDKDKFTGLFITFVAMTALLTGTFIFFWLHSILWAARAFVENRKKARHISFPENPQFAEGPDHHKIKDPHVLYRRFSMMHIFLHLTMATSFLSLSITGLPLKFSDSEWGKMMMGLLGGSKQAGTIHHISAVVMIICFLTATWMSIDFLFFRKDVKGNWKERLLGPDSLFPSLRDLHDIQDMFRWFFFKGPKPTFERWTYWEKFDFLAVFWGMFAIGGSGLILWFPEFFGLFLPGWVFNIATIIHSDEALLATGFIFTVHFFNTHLRPEKFPMDFVIFNGEISKEEMIEERKDQWDRYEKEGISDQFLVTEPSSILWDIVFRILGFTAVFIGIALAVAIVYNMM
jgi:cytochrome b subunit of formate dehydrogenase